MRYFMDAGSLDWLDYYKKIDTKDIDVTRLSENQISALIQAQISKDAKEERKRFGIDKMPNCS